MEQFLTVVGSINVDLTARTPRLPGPGETVGDGTLVRRAGGKGANQAVAAARLAGSSRMIGAVGAGPEGRDLVDALAAAGVDVTGVAVVAAASGTALIVVDDAGENQIAVCPGANAEVTLEAGAIAGATVLAQLEIPMAVVEAAAGAGAGFFALNAAPALPLPAAVLAGCDLVIVNEAEYALLPQLREAPLVALTLGAQGAIMLRHGRETASAPGLPARVVSSVGAGDAFCAALVLALAAGLSHGHALRVGCAVGAAAVADEASQPALGTLASYVRATG